MKIHAVLKNVEEILRSNLGLKYHLVGVRLIKNGDNMIGSLPEAPMAFCQMVRRASISGASYLYGLDYEKCPTAQVVLGLKDLKYVKIDCRVVPPETKKVLISPLSEISSVPEVVLAILTPKQMMDLTIMVRAGESTPLSAEFRGEHACAEFFAKPYVESKPNMSLLCNGAREVYSDFRDNEVVFGAPLEVYIRSAEAIEKITKMRGALCGCRTSDIPFDIIKEFEKIGFLRGTDYFFGKVHSRNIRVYLNKDLESRLKFITIHSPVKMLSEEMAEEVAEKLRKLLPRPYLVKERGYWLDLSVMASEDALGIDLFEGLTVKATIEEFVEKITHYLSKVRI